MMTRRGAAHNLPVGLNSFVGRAEERDRVAELLAASRLVTLAGAPGVGKTRLALEVATGVVDSHPDGVWLVELGPLTDPDLIPQAVASVFGIQKQRGTKATDALAAGLADLVPVLILDNCEHLLSDVAKLAAELLRACPDLTVLATSREPLGMDGECVWRVQPFPLPTGGKRSLERLMDNSAVRLFVDRAAATRPGFRLTPESAPAVVEICRSLDGVPLAIELAAARMDVLSPDEMVTHLEHRLRLLGTRTRSEPSIHKTLEATLEWSYKLLQPEEATLLARLSVFPGSWDLKAAEAVCSDDAIPPETVLGLLDALVRKSLVTADIGVTDTRYRLLGIIRDHAERWLEAATEQTATRDAHCRWYFALVESADADQSDAVRHLEVERDNLRAAFEWALAQGSADTALILASSLVWFWQLLGDLEEGRRWLTRALAASGEQPPLVRAKALWAAGLLRSLCGEVEEAVPLAEESLALASEYGDASTALRAQSLSALLSTLTSPVDALPLLESRVSLAREEGNVRFLLSSLDQLGAAYVLVGDAPAASRCLEEGLQLARREGNPGQEAGVLAVMGRAALVAGDHANAGTYLGESLSINRDLDDPGGMADALSWLGDLARRRGDLAAARELLDESVTRAQKVAPPIIGRCLCILGQVALAAGELTDARTLFGKSLAMAGPIGRAYVIVRCLVGLGQISVAEADGAAARERFEEALALARATGDRQGVAAALHGLADVAAECDSVERAAALYHEALNLRDQTGDRAGLADSLEAVASLANGRGRAVDAARLFGAAQALRDAGGYARPSTAANPQPAIAEARLALGDEQFSEEWTNGLTLSARDAVTYATRRYGARERPPNGWASLTPAEHDVAYFAAQGLTDKEIAKRLFISPRTVGAHLRHVFEKLEIKSRRDLRHETSASSVPNRGEEVAP
jgi:predicted ATPase/DNA-binding CsgD family transcriptional regulator